MTHDKLIGWIESYNKDSNTYRVLLSKFPNIKFLIDKSVQEERARWQAAVEQLKDLYSKSDISWCKIIVKDIDKAFVDLITK